MHQNEAARFFDDGFARRRAMAILRGFTPELTLDYSRLAWAAGMELVEVPLQNEQSERALTTVVADARLSGHIVGAGTIISVELVERAAELGASFTVAPGFDRAVAERSLELGMPHLPGVASGSEVQAALSAGFTWQKAFPASVLGAAWISAMQGPFPTVKFVGTGGITLENAPELLDAGLAAVSLGAVFASLDAQELALF